MKNQLLKAIAEMPSSAAYYMEQRDGYEHKITELLQNTTVADLAIKQAEFKSLYRFLDLANDSFAGEMGWV